MDWIFKNYFIGAVFRRWYVSGAAVAGLWGVREIWTPEQQQFLDRMLISAAAGFALLLITLGLVHVLSDLVKRIREKSIKPLCPNCFTRMPIEFVCQCGKKNAVPFVTYLTKGLFYNRCRECSGKFFDKPSRAGGLRGLCTSCGAVIDNWRFFMFHRGEIVVTIEKSFDWKPGTPQQGLVTGSYHKKVTGCEHYIIKPKGNHALHWFRWDSSVDPGLISQNLTENIDSIWLDKACGSSAWEKTNIILSSVRKDIREIEYGYEGKEDELRAGGLGIKGSKITYDISPEDFLKRL